MDNLIIGNAQIETGEKRLTINGDESRVIAFNPTDAIFAERFYLLIGEMQTALNQFRLRVDALSQDERKDENGIPLNLKEQLNLNREMCEDIRTKIDDVFGAGTAQTAFGETRNLDVYKQFFNGILPFFQQARAEKISQYTTPASVKRNKRKV